MDFLDPKENLKQKILLFSGYILITIAVALGTIVLLYSAYGYGFGKNGAIIQNGFLYLSSQPAPANITLNGVLSKSTTNTRLLLDEGIYNVQLSRTGYRSWNRSIEIDGGTVESFTYPLLIPTKLETSVYKSYAGVPPVVTQSPNLRWLVVLEPGSSTVFDVYDLTNPTKDPVQVTLPDNTITPAQGLESWQVAAWADDNSHVLLEHSYGTGSEYVMLDISSPTQSFNLSRTLGAYKFSSITLNNLKYDQYYLYDSSTQSLTAVSLSDPTTPTLVLSDVDAYSTYGNNTILYATAKNAPAGKEDVDIVSGSQTYKIKELPTGTTYLLDMTGYNGTIYAAAGAASLNKVYIYQNPVGQLSSSPNQAPVPTWVLFVKNPSYLSFSDNAQFIVAEGGQDFGVYDIENDHGYNYISTYPLDAPQAHATWMDGYRLTYVSSGKQLIFDYDDNYQQLLMPANSSSLPFFDPGYKIVYAVNNTPTGSNITKTNLLAPADQ